MMEALKNFFDSGREESKGVFHFFLLIAGAVIAGATLLFIAVPAYEGISLLYQRERAQEQKLDRVLAFADAHADYAAYENTRFKKLVALRQRLQLAANANQAQEKLQVQAVRQGVQIQNIQILPLTEKKAQDMRKLKAVQFQLEVTGNYFSFLRWLRQVEKNFFQVESMEIRSADMGLVRAKLTLHYFCLEN